MEDGQQLTQAVQVRHEASIMAGGEARDVVGYITSAANVLRDIIKSNNLTSKISGRDYVRVEGWTMIAPIVKVWPKGVPAVRPVINDWCNQHYPAPCGYEASVELAREDGSSAGGGVAECSRHERTWANRDDYALKSMAQTRAIGKAYRMSFGFVMAAAGYETTPAEEMPADADAPQQPRTPSPAVARPAGRSGDVSAAERPESRGKEPFWVQPLKSALERHGVALEQLEIVLKEKPTNGVISAWLNEHVKAGKTIVNLVEETKMALEQAEAANDDTVEDAEFTEVE